jgi:hypothetical protein
MSNLVIQKSFAAGEWAPELNARVDLAKYHSAAALLRNFFVDYRGGASTRAGTKYILQAFKSAKKVRLIPFQASFTVNYVLEFGDFYIRFYNNGSPILEAATIISGVTLANPGVIIDNAHGYSTGDWIFISGIGGTTQLNGNYYIVQKINANSYSLTDLFGAAVNTTTFGAFTSNGSAQRVYTLASPFAAADLALVKYTQSVNTLILCHPSYQPQVLTLTTAANWTITAINFGSTVAAPTNLTATPSGSGTGWYSAYVVTAVDINGQESASSARATVPNSVLIPNLSAGTQIALAWSAVPGAISYNIYRAGQAVAAVVAGTQLGFIANVTGTGYQDIGAVAPDFSQTPPVVQNPFQGAGVVSYTVTASGTYSNGAVFPTATVAAPPAGGFNAVCQVNGSILPTSNINSGGANYIVGDIISMGGNGTWQVTSVTGSGAINGLLLLSAGYIQGGQTTPANPVPDPNTTRRMGGYTPASLNLFFGVTSVTPIQLGAGYTSVPAVTFSSGAAAATAVLGTASAGNPSVPGFFDQRLVLAAQSQALQTFYMSQPGSPYNFNVSNPVQADDAINGSIVSGKLNAIKSMLAAPTGLIMFTSQQAWLVNGGANGASVTPIDITATGHAYNGASDVPPIQINFDFLYVQAKGSIIRDLTFNFYTNIYTGTNISVLSSHLFFGYQITEWAYAEEPFSIVWAVRNDGTLLSLTYVKEQEMVGWAHSDTKGQFKSVTSVTETLNSGVSVDAVYVVVQRIINGQTLQYIERMADRFTPYGAEDCWALDSAVATAPYFVGSGCFNTSSASVAASTTTCTASAASGNGVTFTFSVDIGMTNANIGSILRVGGGTATITAVGSGAQCTGNITKAITAVTPNDPNNTPTPTTDFSFWSTPATTFTGLQNLTGQAVTVLADGVPVTGLTASATGSVTIPNAASKVVIGLPFTPQLQTLAIDVGDPTIQSKLKNIPFSSLRVRSTLGLSMGRNFSTVTAMKDLQLGAVGSMLTGLPASQQAVSDLFTGDARTFMDSAFTTAGQYCIQQDQPYYATVLGTIPALTIGDK